MKAGCSKFWGIGLGRAVNEKKRKENANTKA